MFWNRLHWWPLCGHDMLVGLNNPLYAYDFWSLGMNSLLCHYHYAIKAITKCEKDTSLSYSNHQSYHVTWERSRPSHIQTIEVIIQMSKRSHNTRKSTSFSCSNHQGKHIPREGLHLSNYQGKHVTWERLHPSHVQTIKVNTNHGKDCIFQATKVST